MNIGYFRVSMEGETIQDLDRQIEVIVKDKGIHLDYIYKERGSAYNINKMHKRKEFLQLLDKLFDSDNTTIADLFKKKEPQKEINLYIWDYSRIMRNLEFSLLFSILCCFYNVTIISMKDGSFHMEEGMTPTRKLVSYLDLAIKAYSGEQYSYDTSMNIRKARKKVKGMSVSSYGNKWGGQLKYLDHTKEEPHMADVETVRKIEKYIMSIYKENTYSMIINKVGTKYSIKISKGYITKLSRRKPTPK